MGILDLLFGRRRSADMARKRLEVILAYERKALPPNFPQLLKEDLISVFSKYPQFDVDGIEVDIETSEDRAVESLRISIPFKEDKREREN
jgi:cell division topological specificity factor